ncbi:MAG: hypothetical protein QME52_00930 [Bacteroidota bacterium]|nr:hypothetical protein [Bacteroidota bacterium]
MPLPQKNNQIISLDEASKLTSKYRAESKTDAIKGGLFWKEYLQKLLDQPGCVAMRYYYAVDNDGKNTIVLTGVNSNGDDITEGVLLELAPWCPPWCPSNKDLIS